MRVPENLAPLLDVNHCPVKRFGLGENNAVRAFNMRYGPTATEFEIPSFKFRTGLLGEFNVRNALAVAELLCSRSLFSFQLIALMTSLPILAICSASDISAQRPSASFRCCKLI